MEALAAVSLASSVVQFADFVGKILSKGYQFHKSLDGRIEENVQLQAISEGLGRLSNGLSKSSARISPTSREEKALQAAALECCDIAEELKAAVVQLNIFGESTIWKSFRHALKSQWSKDKIEAILKRLQQVRDDLVVHLLVVIK